MTRDGTPDHAGGVLRSPTVLVLSAPSGAGKSSLARALVEAEPSVRLSVSHTTRAARPGEVDGVDYHFVGEREFEAMVEAGAFVEHAPVFDRLYGTSWYAVRSVLSAGHHVVLDIDWQGARQVREAFAGTVSVFLLPPSMDALRSRLVGRGQDSDEIVERRMRAARSELGHYDEFDHVVVNDDFERAIAVLRAILRGERAPPPRRRRSARCRASGSPAASLSRLGGFRQPCVTRCGFVSSPCASPPGSGPGMYGNPGRGR